MLKVAVGPGWRYTVAAPAVCQSEAHRNRRYVPDQLTSLTDNAEPASQVTRSWPPDHVCDRSLDPVEFEAEIGRFCARNSRRIAKIGHLTLDQEIEGSNPSSPATYPARPPDLVVELHRRLPRVCGTPLPVFRPYLGQAVALTMNSVYAVRTLPVRDDKGAVIGWVRSDPLADGTKPTDLVFLRDGSACGQTDAAERLVRPEPALSDARRGRASGPRAPARTRRAY